MFWNLSRRFNLILFLLVSIGFLMTTFLSYQVAKDSLGKQIIEDSLPLTSDNIYSEIQQDLIRPIFISSLMAQDTYLRDWTLKGEQNQDAIIKYLKEIETRYHTVTSFFVSAKTKNYYHPTGILKQVQSSNENDAWFFRTMNLPADQDYEINIDYDTANRSHLVVFVNYKVFDFKGNLLGVTGVGLELEHVKTLVDSYQQRYHRRVYFIDQKGNVTLQAKTGPQRISLSDIPELQALAPEILQSDNRSFTYHDHEHEVFLSTRWVAPFKWYLMVEQSDVPATAKLQHVLFQNIALTIVIIILVLSVAHLTFRGYQQRLERLASTDKLTGALNRQVFEDSLQQVHLSAARNGQPTAIVMIDLDWFKKINDEQGHFVGDQVLRDFANLCREQIRKSDLLCRWGGEEFVLAFPDCNVETAVKIVASLREKLAENDAKLSVTFSAGVVTLALNEGIEVAIQRADDLLYQAKKAGRDRVICEEDAA